MLLDLSVTRYFEGSTSRGKSSEVATSLSESNSFNLDFYVFKIH